MAAGKENMRLTIKAIQKKKEKGEKITALTAYDFPFAKILDEQNLDIILVGDSLGMVLLGYDSTVRVTMRDMIHHVKAVSSAVKHSLVVADMPFGSYATPERALRNAKRFLQECGADAIKLEGGFNVAEQVRHLTESGIPVLGHLGMTPQTASQLGGYKVQARETEKAQKLIQEAQLLEKQGAFGVVLECIPATLGKEVSQKLKIPTIGIGAGAETDGQILVIHDMLGFSCSVKPRFVRNYGNIQGEIEKAISAYVKDVQNGSFPSSKESY